MTQISYFAPLILLAWFTAVIGLSQPAFSEEAVVSIPGSQLACRFPDDEGTAGQIGKVRDQFKALTALARRRLFSRLRIRLRAARLRVRRTNRRRLDARGTPDYDAAEVTYVRAYRKLGRLKELKADLRACRSGSKAAIDDYGDALVPDVKEAWDPTVGYQPAADLPDEPAAEAFTYDSDNYHVTERSIHGVLIVVAVHKLAESAAERSFSLTDFTEVVIDQIHAAIHVNGGFSVDKFVFIVRAPRETTGFSLCRGCVALSADSYDTLQQTHEPFHSWNAKTYQPQPDGTDNLFQLLTHIVEDLTVYISYVIEAKTVMPSLFEDYFAFLWEEYQTYRGSEFDLPYRELAARASEFGTESSIFRTMMGVRGLAVAYAIERELVLQGLTLDDLMTELHRRFGLTDAKYSLDDVRAILLEKSGQSFDEIYDRYLVGNGDLFELHGENPSFPLLR